MWAGKMFISYQQNHKFSLFKADKYSQIIYKSSPPLAAISFKQIFYKD